MTTKTDQIRALLANPDLSTQEIADKVGCQTAYVRAVKQRILRIGGKTPDAKWTDKFKLKHGVAYATHQYRTNEKRRENHRAYDKRKRELEKA